MVIVQFPEPQFNIKMEGEKRFIFDTMRKTWLILTEEEWVRQNFIAYLVREKLYPPTLIALEKEIVLNDLKKRFDILVYDTVHQPWMLVECKAPDVKLTEEVLQQVLRYNITIPVAYIVITNGTSTIAWEKAGRALKLIHQLPDHK
jgi:hypothetical protein